MADAMEDLLTQARPFRHATSSPSTGATLPPANPDADSSEDDDLPPDFLNLTRTTRDKKSKTGAPPKRGTKDFESNRTLLQSRTLEASRNAMWDALGVVRVHHASATPVVKKSKKRRAKATATKAERQAEVMVEEISAQDDPLPELQEPVEEEEEEEQETTTLNPTGTPIGIYNPTTNLTYIAPHHRRGKLFDTIGCDLSGGGVELLPEEALWALEGSKLDVRYPDDLWEDAAASQDHGDGTGETAEPSIPMSLQGAYAAYIGGIEDVDEAEPTPSATASASHDTSRTRPAKTLTQEKYAVYAALKRLGYIVLRAREWNDRERGHAGENEPFTPQTLSRTSTFEAELEAAEAESHGHTPHYSSSSPHPTSSRNSTTFPLTLWHWLISLLHPTHETLTQTHTRQRIGPLIPTGTYRTYPSLYHNLHLIPRTNPLLPTPPSPPRIVVSIHGERESETQADRKKYSRDRREGSGKQSVRFLPEVKTYLVDGSRPTSQEREEAVVDETDVKTPISDHGGVLGEDVNFGAGVGGGGMGGMSGGGGTSAREAVRRKRKQEENPYTTAWDVYKPPGNKLVSGDGETRASEATNQSESDNRKDGHVGRHRDGRRKPEPNAQSNLSHPSNLQEPSNPNQPKEPKETKPCSGGKKTATFKKSTPGSPDFRICVVSARDTCVPTLSQLEALFGEQSLCRPPKTQGVPKREGLEPINAVYSRLRHGYRNVILAVVDEGIVSYVRMADAGFGRERLFERVGKENLGSRGGKGGGGRGGGRGRERGGRGRG